MRQEKYDKIKGLAIELFTELKPENEGPAEGYVSIDEIERHSEWYMVYLSLANLITMEF
jgi:hypothetical protein